MTTTRSIDWTTTPTATSTHSVNDGTVCYYGDCTGMHRAEIAAEFARTYEGPTTDEERAVLMASLIIETL